MYSVLVTLFLVFANYANADSGFIVKPLEEAFDSMGGELILSHHGGGGDNLTCGTGVGSCTGGPQVEVRDFIQDLESSWEESGFKVNSKSSFIRITWWLHKVSDDLEELSEKIEGARAEGKMGLALEYMYFGTKTLAGTFTYHYDGVLDPSHSDDLELGPLTKRYLDRGLSLAKVLNSGPTEEVPTGGVFEETRIEFLANYVDMLVNLAQEIDPKYVAYKYSKVCDIGVVENCVSANERENYLKIANQTYGDFSTRSLRLLQMFVEEGEFSLGGVGTPNGSFSLRSIIPLQSYIVISGNMTYWLSTDLNKSFEVPTTHPSVSSMILQNQRLRNLSDQKGFDHKFGDDELLKQQSAFTMNWAAPGFRGE